MIDFGTGKRQLLPPAPTRIINLGNCPAIVNEIPAMN
jgi:hypothetical protein